MSTPTETRPYLWDGVRAIRTDLIDAIEPYPAGGPGERRVVRSASGREYVSEGNAMDLVDLLMG